MIASAPVSGAMETLVRLRRGKAPRRVHIAIAVRSGDAEPGAACRAFDTFARFLDAARCDNQRVRVGRATTEPHDDHGLLVEAWEATFPKTRPEAFAVLARLVRCSVPGARCLEIREHAPEPALVVRAFEPDTEATLLDLPWQLAFAAAGEPAVRLVLSEPHGPDAAERARTALRLWADVLSLGGFPGGEGHLGSAGTVVDVEPAGERELVARLEGVRCGHDAWEALFEVLLPVHEHAAIEQLEIRAGTFEPARKGGPFPAPLRPSP